MRGSAGWRRLDRRDHARLARDSIPAEIASSPSREIPLPDAPSPLWSALTDRYRLERELGRGGMATVYLVHDLRHDREVAIKVLRPELAAVLGRERFLAEIQVTAKLHHPHILQLLDSGEDGGFLWYALPFVRGESLRARLERERQLGVADALAIAGDIASALDYAHQQGVIHRDVKPENILLHEGEAMLTDFGIALAVREAAGERLTETGLSVGTPRYMSPEQATADRRLDARSDIYSLGAVTYEMLAGEPPFTGTTAQAVITRVITTPPTPLRALRGSVPASADVAITRALAKVPADRFATAAAFGAALRAEHPPEAPPRRFPGWGWLAGIAAIAAMLYLLLPRESTPSPSGAGRAAVMARAQRGFDRRTSAGTVEALAEYSAVIRRDSSDAPAWTGLAKTYVRAYFRYFSVPGIPRDSLLSLAVRAVERARAADSTDADAWVAQAMVSRSVDPTDMTPALRAIRRALSLDSLSGPGWVTEAMILAETGDLPKAMAAWEQTTRVAPLYAEGAAFRGQAYLWRRQFDSAQIWLDSAIALDPEYILARSIRGFVAIGQGDFAKGIDAFDAARRLGDDVEIVNALAGRALAEAGAGRTSEARRLLDRADSLARRYLPAPLHTAIFVAEAYAGLHDVDHAYAWLARVEQPHDLHFQLHLRCDPALDPVAADPRFRKLLLTPRPPHNAAC